MEPPDPAARLRSLHAVGRTERRNDLLDPLTTNNVQYAELFDFYVWQKGRWATFPELSSPRLTTRHEAVEPGRDGGVREVIYTRD